MSDFVILSPARPDAAALLALGRLEGNCRLVEAQAPGGAQRITGWARNAGAPHAPVLLELLLDGEVVGCFPADRTRADLAAKFPANHNLGFVVQVPWPIAGQAARRLEIRRAADLAPLAGSPIVMPHSPPSAEAPLAATLAALAAALDSAAQAAPGPRAELAAQVAARLAELLPARPPRQAALLARWNSQPGATLPTRLPPPRRPRALVIDEGVPDPTRDAGSAAIVSHMQALLGLGFEVGFIAAQALAQDGKASLALAGMGVTC